MLEGRIIKGIGGFYYVDLETEIIECRAKGLFREQKITPLVGDVVKIRISSEDNTGYIEEIMGRKAELVRPPVANITQVVVVASVKMPEFNTWLVDKILVMAEEKSLDIVLCINKADLNLIRSEQLKELYTKAGYNAILTSKLTGLGIEELRNELKDNINVFAGPSGVGKSTLLNTLNPSFKLETGDISKKNQRGKHTTRHVELLKLDINSFILDTPGFSSFDLDFIEDYKDLRYYFRDIAKYNGECKFNSCIHVNEPNCAVKNAVKEGIINKERYDNYLLILDEMKNKKRRY
ncbi:MAG: ribosome small subunit-dependent GTPase A [Gudongella sp.]|nr:ribosome small subunit-dependent GTPase A [Gudongella sp.]